MSGRIALHEAGSADQYNHVVAQLLSCECALCRRYGRTALHEACDVGEVKSVRDLREAGAALNKQTLLWCHEALKETPLDMSRAASDPPMAVVELLLSHSTDINFPLTVAESVVRPKSSTGARS